MLASMASLRLFEVINQNYDLGGQLQTIWIVRNFTWTLQIMLASMASEAFRGQKKEKLWHHCHYRFVFLRL